MTKKTLIVIHGMGTHTEATVKKEVRSALESAFGTYSSLKGKKPSDFFDLVAVEYNSFFEDYRKALANKSDVITALRGVQGNFPLLPKAVDEIAGLEQELTNDSFFATHWLDVILYRFTLLAEPIRLKVAEAIVKAVIAKGSSNVHVLGHSLGTAVLHDTLAKLYGPIPGPTNLSNTSDRLGGVYQIANVSRLLQTFSKVGSSDVRPGIGCCTVFTEHRHKFDPFTKFKPFDPINNGEWIPTNIFRSAYLLNEPNEVTSTNVHALGHYLLNPSVHLPLLRQLRVFPRMPNATERAEAEDAYLSQTVQGKAIAVRDAFEQIDASEPSIRKLIMAAKDFKDMVESFKESF
ncbi:MAG: hypothetical protein ABW095_18740 [Candidatus Thiodiazotropha sp.]